MINVSKAKGMPKGWKDALKVDVMKDLTELANDDGYANSKLSNKLYK